MLGGHLDSVIDGPGINDNGSGTMTILEIARELAKLRPEGATVEGPGRVLDRRGDRAARLVRVRRGR